MMPHFTKIVKRTYSTGININNIKQPIILSNNYNPHKCKQLLENQTISV